jgi:hypothetical protein
MKYFHPDELQRGEQSEQILKLQESLREIGQCHDPVAQFHLRFCASKNPRLAQRYIAKTKGKILLAAMRLQLENQIPTWQFVPPEEAIALGREELSQKHITMHKRLLTQGVVLVCGSDYGQLLSYCVHMMAQLNND